MFLGSSQTYHHFCGKRTKKRIFKPNVNIKIHTNPESLYIITSVAILFAPNLFQRSLFPFQKSIFKMSSFCFRFHFIPLGYDSQTVDKLLINRCLTMTNCSFEIRHQNSFESDENTSLYCKRNKTTTQKTTMSNISRIHLT